MNIRKVTLKDAEQIAEIYNYYVQNTHHTFETDPLNVSEIRERIHKVIETYPYLVAEENKQILGYSYATRFKSRSAYKHSVEISVYVKNSARQVGVGTKLYENLLEILEAREDIHAIIAGISLPNDTSIRLHEKLGFQKVAYFKEVGYKFGRWVDVGYWEKIKS